MSTSDKRNPAVSVRERLLALAHERGDEFQLVLTRYGLERLLYRISRSEYRDRFVLKGAMLFTLWQDEPHRPTRDADFLGFGDASESALRKVFRGVCTQSVEEDGVTFAPDSVRVEPIRDDTEYGGMRVTLAGSLAGARIPIQVDIGVGDAITPAPEEITYPVILDGPAPMLRAYPRETVVAEKYQAIVALGIANSRMKDYYDLWVMASRHEFDGAVLARAIRNTFERRRTDLPEKTPSGLNREFAEDRQKKAQWQAFLARISGGMEADVPSLPEVCTQLERFLGPPTRATHEEPMWRTTWPAGGPWT